MSPLPGEGRDRVYIYDNVHGPIEVTELERRIIDSPEFQRLRRVAQLGLAHLVYPGATHTRFAHSLGTMFVADRMARTVVGLEDPEEIELVRIAALLHDVGQLPLSHTLEAAAGISHEDLGREVVLGTSLGEILSDGGYDPREVARIAWGPNPGVTSLIVSSALDSDRIDYLLRDSLHTGAVYGRPDVDRLLRVVSAANVGGRPRLKVGLRAMHAVEHFLLARRFMFRAVYHHRTVVAFELLARKLYSEAVQEGEMPAGRSLVNLVRSGGWERFDDHAFWRIVRERAGSDRTATCLLERIPPRLVAELTEGDEAYERFSEIEDLPGVISIGAGVEREFIFVGRPGIRRSKVEQILVELPGGELVPLDEAPGGLMSRRIAEVPDVLRVYALAEVAGEVARAVRELGAPTTGEVGGALR